MIDHEKIDPALLGWMTGMGLQAYMRDKDEPNVRMESKTGTNQITHAIASVKFLASVNPGWDEIRRDVSSDPDLLDQVVTGPRRLTVSCHIRSIKQDAPEHAFALAERLRTRLRLPSTEALFKAAGIALNDSTDVLDISFLDRNGRTVGLSAFDLFLNVAAAESDPVTDTIGTIKLTTNYKDEAGNPLPAANQLNQFPLAVDP